MKESRHTHEWVMSHVRISHVPSIDTCLMHHSTQTVMHQTCVYIWAHRVWKSCPKYRHVSDASHSECSHSVSTLLRHPPTSILEVAMERTDLREESRFRDARTIPVVQKISKVTNSKLTSHNVTHLYVWLLSMTSLSSRRPVLSIAIASRNAISRRTNDPCSKENIKSHELENQKSRCDSFTCVTSQYISRRDFETDKRCLS